MKFSQGWMIWTGNIICNLFKLRWQDWQTHIESWVMATERYKLKKSKTNPSFIFIFFFFLFFLNLHSLFLKK